MSSSFNFGTESCVVSKLCKWWRWGSGGKLRRRCCVTTFSNCYFSDKRLSKRSKKYLNFHFSLLISKNGVKRSKTPSLDDSQNLKLKETEEKCMHKKIKISSANRKKYVHDQVCRKKFPHFPVFSLRLYLSFRKIASFFEN